MLKEFKRPPLSRKMEALFLFKKGVGKSNHWKMKFKEGQMRHLTKV